MKRSLVLVLTTMLLAFLSHTVWGQDQVPTLQQALGAAHLARAELALLKGQLNHGKVYLAAAHEADPDLSLFHLKALDMKYKDFPFLEDVVPGYRGRAASFSMDRRFVAYSTRDSVSRVNLDTGALKSVERPSMLALQIEISAKGRFVALCDNMGYLVLFDLEREIQVGQFNFIKEKPRSLDGIRMSFSPDENSIVAHYPYSDEPGLYCLSTIDLSVIRTVTGFPGGRGPLRFLPDGSLLACLRSGTALLDPSTMKTTKTLSPRAGWDVDYLPSKNLLAVGMSRRIEVYNSKTQEKLAEYQAASHNIVMVRFLGDGRYIAYASPKGESGIIDRYTGKPLHIFNVGRDAAVSPDRYLLLTQGKVIDLSACRPFQGDFQVKRQYGRRPLDSTIPEAIRNAISESSDKALSRSGGDIVLAPSSMTKDLQAYGTGDGRTFIYDRNKDQVHVFLTDHYRWPTDIVFYPDNSHFVRLCKTGNHQAGAIEIYSLSDGHRRQRRLVDPPAQVAIAPELAVVAILDEKNRVLLTELPALNANVELLPATMAKRTISVDHDTKTLLVKTGDNVVAFDLQKMSKDRVLPTYAEASRRYGITVDPFESENAQEAKSARVELRKVKSVKTRTSSIVPRSAVDLKASRSSRLSRAQDIAPTSTDGNSYKFHLVPIHNIMDSMVRYYRPMRITLSDQPGEALHKEPKYGVGKPLYGAMQLGDGKDCVVTVVVDEPEDGPSRVYIDRNNDEDLTNDGNGAWSGSSSSSSRLSNVKIDIDYSAGQIPYTFSFYRFKTRLKDVVLYYRDSARQGEIVLGGKTYKIAVLDENADGRFDDLNNNTLLIDLNQDGKLVGSSDSAEHHKLGKPFNVHGKAWKIESMSADGSTLTLKSSAADAPMKMYLEPGYPAPSFAGKDLEGKPIELKKAAKAAKYILLDFWASWCGPCRKEFPYLRRLHAGYRDRGLRILGINMDSKRDAAQQAAKENGLDYTHVFDGLGWKNAVALQYRVSGIPQTYLLDSDMKIVAKNLRGARLERKIAELLGPANTEAINVDETQHAQARSSQVSVTPRRSSETTDAHTITIPEEKLKIPSDMHGCGENLKKVYAAIKRYEKDKGQLPDWLSDLVPAYLNQETLFCPQDSQHRAPYSTDPKKPCSYGWQFSARPIQLDWDPTGKTLFRDWKREQAKVFGDIVPMVRCYHHGQDRILNLSAGGELWWGDLIWEYNFKSDYDTIHQRTLAKAVASHTADQAGEVGFWKKPKAHGIPNNLSPAEVKLLAGPDVTQGFKTFSVRGQAGPVDYGATNPRHMPYIKKDEPTYQILENGLRKGAKPFSDRNYKIRTMPDRLTGLTLLQTKMGHKGIVDERFSIRLSVPKPVYLFLAIDERALETYRQFDIPAWMQKYVPTGEKIFTDDSIMKQSNSGYRVFVKPYPGGTMTLGPAAMNPSRTTMYFAFMAEKE
jgi:thiol-disulfide isomerase/thioredoxin